MDERRGSPRRRTLKSGKILFDRDRVDCTIRTLSETGAGLEVPTTTGIPAHFGLLIEREGIYRVCKVAWTTKTRLGVAFLH